MLRLDDYERWYIDTHAQQAQHPALAAHQRAIIERGLQLFDVVRRTHPKDVEAMLDKSPMFMQMLHMLQRSTYYSRLLSHFEERRAAKDPLFDQRGTLTMFVPLILQDLEGTIKNAFRGLGFLAHLEARHPVTWEGYAKKQQFLKDALDAVQEVLPEVDPLHQVARVADQTFHARFLRNSIGHNDYLIEDRGPGIAEVVFLKGNLMIRCTFEDVMWLFSRLQDLARTLNFTFHLGVRRVTGMPATLPEHKGPPLA